MRLGVYTDYSYVRVGERVYAERAFAVFLDRLASHFEGFTLIGRLNPAADRARYELRPGIRLVGLPYYERLTQPIPVLRSMIASVRLFWRALDDLDAVWLLGPYPLSLVFVVLARVRRRRVLLGVRQDTPAYFRGRFPDRRGVQLLAAGLDRAYAALARRYATVVVGPALGRRYRHARGLLELTVSLIEPDEVVDADAARSRSYDGERTILSVGRLEPEKNPLMLADVLGRLCAGDREGWRLVVCGEGPLEPVLAAQIEALGLTDRAELRGYVEMGDGLRDAYRGSHFLLLTSWTEGLPQVLVEAFAAGLPAVTTDVGGIGEAVGDAAVLVPAGDAVAASEAMRRLVEDPRARGRLIDAAVSHARAHTIDHEVSRLAGFIRGSSAGDGLPRRGIGVALLGPDGAGKSTVAAAIASGFPRPVRIVYMGLDQGGRSRRRRSPRGFALVETIGRQWGGWLAAQYHRFRGRLVIFDRYAYDALLPARRPLSWLERVRRFLLARACPAPQLVVILDAPAETLFARSGEHDPELLELHRQGLIALHDRLRRSVVVDAEQEPEAVAEAVVSAISDAWAGYTGAPR